ncbi:MAG: polyphosphate kinase 2 [Magnetococcales bacterium]|nr:polyphosphate kinase 2 [Magnetococcales bacterium]
MGTSEYLQQVAPLHIELVKMQNWVKANGVRVVVLFEGRDSSGKGGTVKRMTEHMNPRGCRIVALDKPTPQEETQWYFQRYINHLPSAGEIVLFDRSWYSRAGVERVMGFCNKKAVREFLRSVPEFEKMLVNSGILLFKFYFSIDKAEQRRRLRQRRKDPLRWRAPNLVERKASGYWDQYTQAKEDIFTCSSTLFAPWTIIKSNDKNRARVECIKFLLSQLDYAEKGKALLEYDRRVVRSVQEELGFD